MNDGTVRRYKNYKGMMEESTNGKFILASDYDTLRTQARELAGQQVSLCDNIQQFIETISREAGVSPTYHSLYGQAELARLEAQAVLKEGG